MNTPFDFYVYLAARDIEQQNRAEVMITALTERELLLVREAAVMGFVQGRESGYDNPVPQDNKIVTRVLLAADAMEDLYPTLAALSHTDSTENQK